MIYNRNYESVTPIMWQRVTNVSVAYFSPHGRTIVPISELQTAINTSKIVITYTVLFLRHVLQNYITEIV